MKIKGTIFEFTKYGDSVKTNMFYPNLPVASYDILGLSDTERRLMDDVSSVVYSDEKTDDEKAKSVMTAFARRIYKNFKNSSHLFGYGQNWNFGAVITDEDLREELISFITSAEGEEFKAHVHESEDKSFVIDNVELVSGNKTIGSKDNANNEESGPDVSAITIAISGAINFFSEFDFEPNFRFLNTISRVGSGNVSAAKEYIKDYFELIDSPYLNDICEKMKSEEFKRIINIICAPSNTTKKKLNTRFELYYGSQGTGKTTEAVKRSNGKCVVCNNSLLPNDLMEDFGFDDGKATFHPSALCKAMENGEVIVLDEFNLLPFESIRFLQGIIDGKESFVFKGHEVKVKEGFKIIGTMNLNVNGMTYALPSPIVDRCEVIKKYKLTAKDLVGSIV